MFDQARNQLFTFRDLLRFAVSRFNEAGIFCGHGSASIYDEAAYLILHTLHLPPDNLEPFLDGHLTENEKEQVLNIIKRRISKRIPAAYLTNEAWLGDFSFYVDERVIVPRSPIAELLQENFIPWIEDSYTIHTALDLCTGSGCLAILLAYAFTNAKISAADISNKALEVANRNVLNYHLGHRIDLIQSDFFTELTGHRYDLIVSNPPYVNTKSMSTLPKEYLHEPHNALAGGEDGLDAIRIILHKAGDYLQEQGLLIVEIGHNRYALEKAFPRVLFTWLETSERDNDIFLLKRDQLPK
ncbi:MAG: 50S ribosomal protein L3 N(5)-glutamine methyltransferase [Nitrosomonadaceae bacterium]|nr:50S ribosomal protein L3 N(5)-glutamine methyltransferase [Nitrosospira sp.]MDW7642771.1 50S ribosomal protein L3 N(5)-glutamine methyltransferase [Nitrosomonadaceae bacterium]MDW7653315.1 50S ribosomal protein L3 N(5)-glutamine methyltransferase [Nitrosomonadaceae bacterium]MDW7663848.1 50S ribosomal protein L3 N(5)-glutamine methyltransferase [Nitrosomonadaceae bacterium]MDW7665729.1 50S ribosomal protein L3 N(5)-glutamine methyltransferase [Nitrosomonadaceae bacterium]